MTGPSTRRFINGLFAKVLSRLTYETPCEQSLLRSSEISPLPDLSRKIEGDSANRVLTKRSELFDTKKSYAHVHTIPSFLSHDQAKEMGRDVI